MFEIKKFRKNLTDEEYKKIIQIFGNKRRLNVFIKNIANPSINYAEEKEFIVEREKELIPLIKNKKTLIQFGEFVSKTNLFILDRLLLKRNNEKLANLLNTIGGEKMAFLLHQTNVNDLTKMIKYTNPKQINILIKKIGVRKTGELLRTVDERVIGGMGHDRGIYELGKLINMIGGDAVGKIVSNSHPIVVGRIISMIDAKPIAELTKILGLEKTGKFMLNAGDMETKEMLLRIGGKRLGKIIFHTGEKLSELLFMSGATKTGELFQKIGTENSILLLKQANIKTIKNFLSYSSGMALGNLIKKTGVTKTTNFMESIKNYQNVELFLEYGAFSIQKDSNLKQLYRRFNTLQFNKNELLVLNYLHRNPRVKKMVKLINKKTPLTIRERDELVQNKLFLEKFVERQKLKNLKNGGLRGTSLRTLFNLEKAFENDNKNWKFDVPLNEKDVLALARKKEKGLGLKEISFSYKSENFSLKQNEKIYLETLLKKVSNTQNKFKNEATSLLKYLRTKQFNQPNPEYVKEPIKQPIQSEKIFKEILKIYLKINPKKTKEIISLGLFLFIPPNKKVKSSNDLLLLENIYNKKIMEFLKEAGINKNPYEKEIKNLQNIIKRINTQKPQEKKFVLDSRKDFRDANPGALGESCFNYSEFNMVADTKKFNLIKLIDKQTGKAEGVIHAHTIEKEGKKVLMITGFELKNRVVNNSRTGILRTKKILDGIKEMAQKNGYSNVMITTEPYAISNRDAIKKYFTRNYKEMELKHKIYGSTVKTARNIAKIKPIEPKMRQRRK